MILTSTNNSDYPHSTKLDKPYSKPNLGPKNNVISNVSYTSVEVPHKTLPEDPRNRSATTSVHFLHLSVQLSQLVVMIYQVYPEVFWSFSKRDDGVNVIELVDTGRPVNLYLKNNR